MTSEPDPGSESASRTQRRIDVVSTVLLALATLATAWAGYHGVAPRAAREGADEELDPGAVVVPGLGVDPGARQLHDVAPRAQAVAVEPRLSFFQPDAATIDYGAAKAALVNRTKTLSQEFGPRRVRVNSVSPGPVATDLWLGEHGVAENGCEGHRR